MRNANNINEANRKTAISRTTAPPTYRLRHLHSSHYAGHHGAGYNASYCEYTPII